MPNYHNPPQRRFCKRTNKIICRTSNLSRLQKSNHYPSFRSRVSEDFFHALRARLQAVLTCSTPSAPLPALLSFYYRRSFDALNSEFSPYSAHAIQLGDRSFRTLAHLYWTIAFDRNHEALKAIYGLTSVADHDESIAHLLRIALHFNERQTADFMARRLSE